jgi:nitrogen fixation NifU-like protein
MPLEEDELYQQRILDHYEEPFHRGHCPRATHAHEDENPLCGDVVRVELALDADGTIRDAYFEGDGCCISQASASMLVERMHGRRVDDVKSFTAQDMLALLGAKLTPNRQKCCLLPWRAMQSAIYSPVGDGDEAPCRGGGPGDL